MTETKHPAEKLTVAPAKGTLSLKRPGIEQGVVKQSFSHGRTKTVMVEKVKSRRTDIRPEPAPAAPATAPGAGPAAATAKRTGGLVLPKLTSEEHAARASALESAKVREAEERRIAEEDARRRNARETVELDERKAAETRKREEDERRRHEEETKLRAEREAEKRFGEGEKKGAAKPAAKPKAGAAPLNLRNVVPEVEEDEGPRTPRG